MTTVQRALAWRVSSRCGGTGTCVQVAGRPGGVLVRDARCGPTIPLTSAQFTRLINTIKEQS
ncbi:DUF397 domain-containing protein [Spirillospora sp. NPDC127200]